MAKATLAERTVFANLAYIRITPWTSEGSGPDGDTYDVTEVVGDTTTVEQAENDSNVLEHEFSSQPLYENIQLGDKTFACESIDLQNEVLKGLFGWTVTEGGAYAPVSYKPLYATIEMGFNSTDDVIVLPKVLLNSRAVIASMKTDASRANINGTCYTAFVDDNETDMAILKGAKAADDGAAVLAKVKATATGGGSVSLSVAITSLSANAATLEATLEGAVSASAYEWSDGKTITGTTAATNSLTSLTADTEYKYKVRARIDNDNVAGYTPWVGISFRTLAE